MAVSQSGRPRAELEKNIVMFDHKGFVHAGRNDLFPFNKPYMHNIQPLPSVFDAVKALKITTIIGVSGCPGLITKDIVQQMSKNVERPVVFALSNPTAKAECSAQQAYEWSDRKALFCSGSPFPDYQYGGKTFVPAQANNSWIFPAVGFALVSMRAKHCPAKVFEVAALSLAKLVKQSDLYKSSLLPPLSKIRDYSFDIALDVSKYLVAEGLATVALPQGVTLEQHLKAEQFNPSAEYQPVY
jgi:malate dehydrogenase (oxaloacetate-decarboxylating)/malate dehydrogenase (oxaloacetate-decarboxylating)(NADP+)